MDLTADRVVEAALAEDIGPGDVTSDSLFEPNDVCRARLLLKEEGVVCGLGVAEAIFRSLDPELRYEPLVRDGDLTRGPIAVLEGRTRAVLTGERTALNFLGRLSGIATVARYFTSEISHTGCRILDTRKTTPGLRELEKYATRCGGATNHRMGLWDAVLIKDNHLAAIGGGSISEAIERARSSGTPVEVECDTLDQVREALAAGADRILLDNMGLPQLRDAVALAAGRVPLEASGGVTLDTVRAIAETGVDFVSAGALTHSARSLDVSLEVIP
jgi:nicotinate-nucleotide pyrophosphorylase (carboxylating)